MDRAIIDLYCPSFRQVPHRIALDVDDTIDAVHGEQQPRLFNAHHDEYGFRQIVVFDGEGRFVAAVLRLAKQPSGREVRAFLRRPLRQIRANWPAVEVLLQADSNQCAPEALRWCRANKVGYLLGVAPTSTLCRHVERLGASTAARFAASEGNAKLRCLPSSMTVPQAGTGSSVLHPHPGPSPTSSAGQGKAGNIPGRSALRMRSWSVPRRASSARSWSSLRRFGARRRTGVKTWQKRLVSLYKSVLESKGLGT